MRTFAAPVLLAFGIGALGQALPTLPPLPRAKVQGDLPATLKVKIKTASLGDATLPSGVRRPMNVAPSAIAYGHSEFSPLPPGLSFYAGLAEKGNTAPQALLDTVEIRFEKGISATAAIDTTQGEVLLGPRIARKLGMGKSNEATVELPPFSLGPLRFSGVPGRLVTSIELPGESVEAVVPLMLFQGFGMLWDPAAGRLTMHAAGSPPGLAGGTGTFAVATRWERGALCLRAVLQDRTEGDLLINPAQPHSAIDSGAARKAGIDARPMGEVVRNEIVKGGMAEEARIRLGSTQVVIRSARVLPLAQSLPPGTLGILGRDVVGLFGYYIEPGAVTVQVIPPRREASKPR